MKRLFFLLFIFASTPLWAEDFDDGLLNEVHFFAGGQRINIDTRNEGQFVLAVHMTLKGAMHRYEKEGKAYKFNSMEKVLELERHVNSTPNCTAFFIENSRNSWIIGTARHCFHFRELDMCQSKEDYLFRPLVDRRIVGKCKRIVSRHEHSDFMIMEVEFSPRDDQRLRTMGVTKLSMGVFPKIAPNRQRQLEMYGFPGDSQRKSQPTKSSHCFVQSVLGKDNMENFYANSINQQSKKEMRTKDENDTSFFRSMMRIVDDGSILLRHNCDTYAGNSGGPMLLKNTRTFIGLPRTYNPTLQVFSEEKFGWLETPLRLIQKDQQNILNNGIPIKMIDESIQGRANMTRDI